MAGDELQIRYATFEKAILALPNSSIIQGLGTTSTAAMDI